MISNVKLAILRLDLAPLASYIIIKQVLRKGPQI